MVTRSGTLPDMLTRLSRSPRATLLTCKTMAGAEVLVADGAVIDAWCPISPSADLVIRVRRAAHRGAAQELPGGGTGTTADASVDLVLACSEAVLDTVRELTQAPGAHRWRTRRARQPSPGRSVRLPIGAVLVEVDRRHAVLTRLGGLLTPDTSIVRASRIPHRRLRIRPDQWALLAFAGSATTPRDLALDLGDSVFRTTRRAAELLSLGLVRPAARRPSRGQLLMLDGTGMRT